MIITRLLKINLMIAFCMLWNGCSHGDKKNDSPLGGVSTTAKMAIYTNMVRIKGGAYIMGSPDPAFQDASPLHKVIVNDFWMDQNEVTNAEFAVFVKATNYQTVAERPLDPADYSNIDPKDLVPGSAVFTPPVHTVNLNRPIEWWKYVAGANWRHPAGPGSDLQGKANYPVVHVCYTDALAYAKWCGKRLPTEAEWEYAARAGHKNSTYYWGKELQPKGKWMANNYQGHFPDKDIAADGFNGLAPVKMFPANKFGLYDMEGNVWEWCNDFYRPDYYRISPVNNPQGPIDSDDPDEPGTVKRVQRGGSFICSEQYCIRFKTGSRGKGEINSGSNNLGFRCVKN
jgi:sulfatase modifying factor 1